MVELANDRAICVEFNMTSLVTDTVCNELFLHVDIDSACFDSTQVTMNERALHFMLCFQRATSPCSKCRQ